MLRCLLIAVCLWPWIAMGPVSATEKSDLPLVFEDDFQKGADRWQPTDPAAWRIAEVGGRKVYNQFAQSKYKPPYRSPFNISLPKDMLVSDFVLTVRVESTSKSGAHQDMCLFFNHQDPAHFYYVHLGMKPDPNSSQIMIVNDAPRKMITTNKSPGIPWDDQWHSVKIVRDTKSGKIEVYFDDLQKPNMVAQDKTFTWGQVGLGSFDDSGYWDDFKLYGARTERK